LYSASDVARLSGAPLRAVRYWALTRVLEAAPESDRAGTGKHRQFSKQEVLIACVVQYFSSRGLQVGQLTNISKTLRAAILSDEWTLDCLNGAIRDDFKVYMILLDSGLEWGWISLYSKNPPTHNDRPLTQPIVANIDGVAKTVTMIRPATLAELAGIFWRLTNDNPGVVVVLLNACFSRLRSEWQRK
jgi:DNA-binding transcriptional MerR regulator